MFLLIVPDNDLSKSSKNGVFVCSTEYDLSKWPKNGGFWLSYQNMTSANHPKMVVLLIVPEYDLSKSSKKGVFAYSTGM